MLKSKVIITLVAISFIFGGVVLFAQEDSNSNSDNTSSQSKEAVAMEWVMGIVKSVNLEDKTIDVSYYDFENDEDKVITISTNDRTEYIGMKLKDINPGDDIEVSYMYSNDGTPIAEAVITAKLKDIESGDKSEEDTSKSVAKKK